MVVPDESYAYNAKELKQIEYKELDLENDWETFDIHHDLTDTGLVKFADDWNNLITWNIRDDALWINKSNVQNVEKRWKKGYLKEPCLGK